MIVISSSNVKGGVSKTTVAATLAAGLHHRGNRVLMIDADPQTNFTMCFTEEPQDGDPSLYNIFSEGAKIDDIKIEIKPGLDLVVGDFSLCSADMEFLGKVGSLKLLGKAIKACKEKYDYVVIDTPPNLGFLSLNAFMASDYIITPMTADSFSLKAIRLLKKTLDEVSEDLGRSVPVAGVLLTRYSDRTNIAKILEENVNVAAQLLNTTVFESRIRQATVIPESQLAKMDIFEYAPKSPVANDFDMFIKELLKRIEAKSCKE